MTIAGPITRILLRYIAGFLVARGLLDHMTADTLANDMDLIMLIEPAIGILIGVVTEFWYARARKSGGAT